MTKGAAAAPLPLAVMMIAGAATTVTTAGVEVEAVTGTAMTTATAVSVLGTTTGNVGTMTAMDGAMGGKAIIQSLDESVCAPSHAIVPVTRSLTHFLP